MEPIRLAHAFVRNCHHWPINSQHAWLVPRAHRCVHARLSQNTTKYRRKICISKSRPIDPCVAAHLTDAPMTATTSLFCIVTCVYATLIFRSVIMRVTHNRVTTENFFAQFLLKIIILEYLSIRDHPIAIMRDSLLNCMCMLLLKEEKRVRIQYTKLVFEQPGISLN